MVNDIGSELAQLIAVLVQAICYGFYLVTFVPCLASILRDPLRWRCYQKVNWWIFTVAILLWAIGTVNLSLGFLRLVQAFILNKRPNKPITELGEDWLNIVKPTLVSVQIVLADCIMVWRFWVVYGRSRALLIVPLLLWFGGLATAIWAAYLQVTLTSGSRVYSDLVYPVSTAFWAVTIALNTFTTSAIVCRIWTVDHETASCISTADFSPGLARPAILQRAMKIIIESALIYSATSVTVFICQVLKSNVIYITSAADVLAIGISFNLIVTRVAEQRESIELPQFQNATFCTNPLDGTFTNVTSKPQLVARSQTETIELREQAMRPVDALV